MTYICARRNLPISDALQMQIEVQRRLHEQLEVSIIYCTLCIHHVQSSYQCWNFRFLYLF